jgi:hypothetical protein
MKFRFNMCREILLINLMLMAQSCATCKFGNMTILILFLRFYPTTDCFTVTNNQFDIYLENGECKIYYVV